jgi:hypothetical protein
VDGIAPGWPDADPLTSPTCEPDRTYQRPTFRSVHPIPSRLAARRGSRRVRWGSASHFVVALVRPRIEKLYIFKNRGMIGYQKNQLKTTLNLNFVFKKLKIDKPIGIIDKLAPKSTEISIKISKLFF